MERLQVWFEDQLVGHFDVDMGGYVGKDMIPIMIDPLQDLSRPYKETRIPLKTRHHSVPGYELAGMHDDALVRYLALQHVPALHDHTKRISSSGSCVIYSWTAAVFPDLETYERIFDLDLFIPADVGGVDEEYRERLKEERAGMRVSGWKTDKVWFDEVDELTKAFPSIREELDTVRDALGVTTTISEPKTLTLKDLRDMIIRDEPVFPLTEREKPLYRPMYEMPVLNNPLKMKFQGS